MTGDIHFASLLMAADFVNADGSPQTATATVAELNIARTCLVSARRLMRRIALNMLAQYFTLWLIAWRWARYSESIVCSTPATNIWLCPRGTLEHSVDLFFFLLEQ